MRDKWLISVTAGKIQCNGILEAKKIGLKIISIDHDSNAPGFDISDEIIHAELHNVDFILNKLKNLNVNIIAAISFCSEVGLNLCALIREEFNLPGERINTLFNFMNKGLQRNLLEKNFLPNPLEWSVVSSTAEAISVLNNFCKPLIIKPTESSGSRGVFKIKSNTEKVESIIKKSFHFSRNSELIIESYMDGIECTVESFTNKGVTTVLAITEKNKAQNTDGLVANELKTFSGSKKLYNEISNIIKKSIKILNYNDGPCHSEVIIMKNNEIGIVEIAARGGGFLVFDSLVPAISGINIAELSIKQACGQSININKVQKNYSTLKFITPKKGTIKSITGFKEVNQIDGVTAGSFVKVGDDVNDVKSDGDRLGYILSTSNNLKKTRRNLILSEYLIKFQYEN